MKVAFGMKAHSGWAALVVLGKRDGQLEVVDRRRIELVEEVWARQPYHAVEGLQPDAARDMVKHAIAAARRIAVREIRAAVKQERDRGNEVTGCGVLIANPLPDWTIDEILAVHFRMHAAEGMLFRDALVAGTEVCRLRLAAIPEKLLGQHAERALRTPMSALSKQIAALGKPVGPPWGRDQKEAALAALIALRRRST